MRHRWHDFLDWCDRNADLFPYAALLAVLLAVGATCAGSSDDGRGYTNATTHRSPSVVVGTAPGSPVSHGGVEPGATDEGGAG